MDRELAIERNAQIVLAFFSVVASNFKSVHLLLKRKGKKKLIIL